MHRKLSSRATKVHTLFERLTFLHVGVTDAVGLTAVFRQEDLSKKSIGN